MAHSNLLEAVQTGYFLYSLYVHIGGHVYMCIQVCLWASRVCLPQWNGWVQGSILLGTCISLDCSLMGLSRPGQARPSLAQCVSLPRLHRRVSLKGLLRWSGAFRRGPLAPSQVSSVLPALRLQDSHVPPLLLGEDQAL